MVALLVRVRFHVAKLVNFLIQSNFLFRKVLSKVKIVLQKFIKPLEKRAKWRV
jgi:hypothetical protein